MLQRAYEATGYGQWVATNYLAVPALMLASVLVVLTVAFFSVAIRHGVNRTSPELAIRLAAVLVLDALAAWVCFGVLRDASISHLVTFGNALWIGLPTLLVVFVLYGVWRQSSGFRMKLR